MCGLETERLDETELWKLQECIRIKYIRGTSGVERIGVKLRESRIRWYKHVLKNKDYREL